MSSISELSRGQMMEVATHVKDEKTARVRT